VICTLDQAANHSWAALVT